jgi:DNA-binding LacI/PurR family transcriptional regulator
MHRIDPNHRLVTFSVLARRFNETLRLVSCGLARWLAKEVSHLRSPTILDVAERAFVSRSTAALALSARADKVSSKTRERVLAAARELGYRPNPAGTALRTGRGGSVAFLYHELSDFEMEHGSGPMWARFAMLLGMDLGKAGYRLLMLPKAEIGPGPLAASAVLAFAESDGHVVLPELAFGTPVWVASAAESAEPLARITHDFALITQQVLDHVSNGGDPNNGTNLRIAMCVRGVEDPPFTYAMESELRARTAATGIELISQRIDPREPDQLAAFEDLARTEAFDAIFCWGAHPVGVFRTTSQSLPETRIVVFCENELMPEFDPGTPHVSFRVDDAAHQLADALLETIGGGPAQDITLSHTFSHA